MARTSGAKAKVTSAAETVAGYVDPLIKDEKLRQRLLDVLAVGAAAGQRAKRQTGVSSLARRLGTDPVLRQQVAELTTHLRDARDYLQKQGTITPARKKSHKLRNTTLVLAGAGVVLAKAPSLREKLVAKAKALFFGEHDDDAPVTSTNSDAPVGSDAPA